MTAADDDGWARPDSAPRHPMFDVRRAEPADEAADLDWVRQRLVELDDQQRALEPTDIAARHALLEATDGLRTILRDGHADQIRAVREGWESRAGRKGSHEVDPEVLVGFVKSMMSSGGGIG